MTTDLLENSLAGIKHWLLEATYLGKSNFP